MNGETMLSALALALFEPFGNVNLAHLLCVCVKAFLWGANLSCLVTMRAPVSG